MKQIMYKGKPASLVIDCNKMHKFVCESLDDAATAVKPEGVLMRLKGTFATIDDTKNRNGRTYDFTNYYSQVQSLMPQIKKMALLGELEHPKRRVVKLPNVSHRIVSIDWNPETKSFEGYIDILDTPNGQVAYGIAKAGSPLYISSRAIGVVDQRTGKTTLLKLITYDLVATPGFANAEFHDANRVNESVCYVNESEDDDDFNEEDEDTPVTELNKDYLLNCWDSLNADKQTEVLDKAKAGKLENFAEIAVFDDFGDKAEAIAQAMVDLHVAEQNVAFVEKTDESDKNDMNMNEQNKTSFVAAYLSGKANAAGVEKLQQIEELLDTVGCDYSDTGLAVAYDKLSFDDKKKIHELIGIEFADEAFGMPVWQSADAVRRKALLKAAGITNDIDAIANTPWLALDNRIREALNKLNVVNESIKDGKDFVKHLAKASDKVKNQIADILVIDNDASDDVFAKAYDAATTADMELCAKLLGVDESTVTSDATCNMRYAAAKVWNALSQSDKDDIAKTVFAKEERANYWRTPASQLWPENKADDETTKTRLNKMNAQDFDAIIAEMTKRKLLVMDEDSVAERNAVIDIKAAKVWNNLDMQTRENIVKTAKIAQPGHEAIIAKLTWPVEKSEQFDEKKHMLGMYWNKVVREMQKRSIIDFGYVNESAEAWDAATVDQRLKWLLSKNYVQADAEYNACQTFDALSENTQNFVKEFFKVDASSQTLRKEVEQWWKSMRAAEREDALVDLGMGHSTAVDYSKAYWESLSPAEQREIIAAYANANNDEADEAHGTWWNNADAYQRELVLNNAKDINVEDAKNLTWDAFDDNTKSALAGAIKQVSESMSAEQWWKQNHFAMLDDFVAWGWNESAAKKLQYKDWNQLSTLDKQIVADTLKQAGVLDETYIDEAAGDKAYEMLLPMFEALVDQSKLTTTFKKPAEKSRFLQMALYSFWRRCHYDIDVQMTDEQIAIIKPEVAMAFKNASKTPAKVESMAKALQTVSANKTLLKAAMFVCGGEKITVKDRAFIAFDLFNLCFVFDLSGSNLKVIAAGAWNNNVNGVYGEARCLDFGFWDFLGKGSAHTLFSDNAKDVEILMSIYNALDKGTWSIDNVNESIESDKVYQTLDAATQALIDKCFPNALVDTCKALAGQGESINEVINDIIESAKAAANDADAKAIDAARDNIIKWLASLWQTQMVAESKIVFKPNKAHIIDEGADDKATAEDVEKMIQTLQDSGTLNANQATELTDAVADAVDLDKIANKGELAKKVAEVAADLGFDVDADDCMEAINESVDASEVRTAMLKGKGFDDFDFKTIDKEGSTFSVVVDKANNQLVGIEIAGNMTEANQATLAAMLKQYLATANTDESLIEIRKEFKAIKIDESHIAKDYAENGNRINVDESHEDIKPLWLEKMPKAYEVIYESLTDDQKALVATQASMRQFVNESDVASFFRTRNWQQIRNYEAGHAASWVNEHHVDESVDDKGLTDAQRALVDAIRG